MNKLFITIFLPALFLCLVFSPAISRAQTTDALSLTITPPFFELNVNPGDSWSSSIRVVNTNPGDLQVHAMAMGFAADDEFGHGSFTPLSQLAGDGDALANWITVSSAPVVVQPDGAADIPFSVSVPQNAAPGGHYAAILIGTGNAAPTSSAGSQVGISSFISALVFVRVSGNIQESALVNDFSADKSYYQTPDVHFSVNIQNNGNVHVRPIGMIQIYNAFGKERGEIAVNGTGTFGYVLPSSSREFDEEWQGQPSLWDIGPYTAVLSLAYGENGTKSITRTIGFWVLPIDQLAFVILSIIIAAMIVTYLLRRAVRKMLAREMERYGGPPAPYSHHRAEAPPEPARKTKSAAPPPSDDDGTIHIRYPYDE